MLGALYYRALGINLSKTVYLPLLANYLENFLNII